MFSRLVWVLVVLLFAGCKNSGADQDEESEPSGANTAPQSEQGTPAEGEEASLPRAQADTPESNPSTDSGGAGFEGVRNGRFESERFNLRFLVPGDWTVSSAQTGDSLTFDGPGGIQMVVANSESIQLVDGNFSNLNDRVSFDQVNILPDRSQTGPVNGLPGYRVEGDAVLRGEDMPIYFVSQAISVPGAPVMVTIFIPGDNYFEHSDTMHAVLDSLEALDLRPN